MSGLGATNMDNSRHRVSRAVAAGDSAEASNLPPPGSAAAEVKDPNWPKDPDVQRRKEAVAANKNHKPSPRRRTIDFAEQARAEWFRRHHTTG